MVFISTFKNQPNPYTQRPPSSRQADQQAVGKAVRTPRGFYRRLHAIADKAVPKVMQAFMDSVQRLKEGIKVTEIRDAIEEGAGPDQVIQMLQPEDDFDWVFAPLVRQLEDVFVKAGREAEDSVPEKLIAKAEVLQGRFDLTNPAATEFLRNYKFNLIKKNIGPTTREGIRSIVTNAFERGGHPYQQAREIKNLVGLTPRQATAVNNYRDTLMSEGVSGDKLASRVERYRERQLRYRARNIARTETIRASSEGQEALWAQAQDEGLISDAQVKRVWIVTQDDRLCPICQAIGRANSNGVGLKESFKNPQGFVPVQNPPAHPQCRCAVGLEERTEEETEQFTEQEQIPTRQQEPNAISQTATKLNRRKYKEFPGGRGAKKWAKDQGYSSYMDDLGIDRKDTVLDYTIGGNDPVNSYLRYGKGGVRSLTPYRNVAQVKEAVKGLDNIIKNAPSAPSNLTVYRGSSLRSLAHAAKVDFRDIPEIIDDVDVTGKLPTSFVDKLKGKVLRDKGFVSTSFNKKYAHDAFVSASDEVLMRVKVPKGAKGTTMWFPDMQTAYSEELEFLLQRDSYFEIVGTSTVRLGGRDKQVVDVVLTRQGQKVLKSSVR